MWFGRGTNQYKFYKTQANAQKPYKLIRHLRISNLNQTMLCGSKVVVSQDTVKFIVQFHQRIRKAVIYHRSTEPWNGHQIAHYYFLVNPLLSTIYSASALPTTSYTAYCSYYKLHCQLYCQFITLNLWWRCAPGVNRNHIPLLCIIPLQV